MGDLISQMSSEPERHGINNAKWNTEKRNLKTNCALGQLQATNIHIIVVPNGEVGRNTLKNKADKFPDLMKTVDLYIELGNSSNPKQRNKEHWKR